MPSYFWTAKSNQKLPAVMASGHGLPARVHYENTHFVSAHSDFSRAALQTMPFRLRVQKMSFTHQGRKLSPRLK
jgi:hypothetical protein